MASNSVHTVPDNGGWINEVGGRQVGERFDRKEYAVKAGREEARLQQTEHHIHNADGTIAAKNSYGHDPRNVPG